MVKLKCDKIKVPIGVNSFYCKAELRYTPPLHYVSVIPHSTSPLRYSTELYSTAIFYYFNKVYSTGHTSTPLRSTPPYHSTAILQCDTPKVHRCTEVHSTYPLRVTDILLLYLSILHWAWLPLHYFAIPLKYCTDSLGANGTPLYSTGFYCATLH